MKEFWLTEDGLVSRHKIRRNRIVGHGIIHSDQKMRIYTTADRIIDFSYDEIRTGTHNSTTIFFGRDGEKILKIDIISGGNNEIKSW